MTDHGKALEAAARAVAAHKGYNPDETWEEWTRPVDADGCLISYPRIRWREFEAEAQVAVAAFLAQREADGVEFAAAFLEYVDSSDLDDLDFGRGLKHSGLIEQARAMLAARPKGDG